ncbi:hypothetical protein QNI16_19090 [Cytophagaceae bacterium YF14B1]|uniref:Uncharacterized protein n=1 Tax=Xanthocytophaga flava TaxID=3048013 RepID=A0AAE3UAB5_9BACT|nr:hypothetical protein [Xanthocytophaga flavus]MDJ1482614.1 hypothetical protein [Xanthocytophaga flavus]
MRTNVYSGLSFLWLIFFILGMSFSGYAQQATPVINTGKSVTALENHVQSILQYVVDNKKTVDQLSQDNLADLPVGIARKIGNTTYIIAIDSARFDPRTSNWSLTAYTSVTLPGSTQPLAFAGRNIIFNQGGISASADTRLALISTQTIPLSQATRLELPGDGRNYVSFNCNGFQAINLKGVFRFNGEMLQPDTRLAPQDTVVSATLEINATDLNNLIFNTQITPFQVKGIKDFSFLVRSATVDMSDLANPPGISLPVEYQQDLGENILLWRGFYLKEVDVTYNGLDSTGSENTTKTKATNTVDNGKRPVFTARNLLIDDSGVSGSFSAFHLLTLQNGSADGWPFSIDSLGVKLAHNRLAGGGLAGYMQIPLLGDESFGYRAEMEQKKDNIDYRFAIQTTITHSYKGALGEIKLNKGCVISMAKRNGKMMPSALLHGTLSVKISELELSEVAFENLGLVTQKPYIVSGVFAIDGKKQAKSVGFPIQIDSIRAGVFQNQVGLGVGVSLNLMNQEDKPPLAKTYIQMLAKIEQVQTQSGDAKEVHQRWKLDKIKVDDIILQMETSAISMKGRLTLFSDDRVYGNGFRGSIKFGLKKVLDSDIEALAYFGSKSTFRYWHVDVAVPVGNVPLMPPAPVFLKAIMGGMSYHMVQQGSQMPDFSKMGVESASASPAAISTPQITGSEKIYLPDSTTGLSFLAGVALVVGADKACNADVMLEVAFREGGGMKYVQFNGAAYFMTNMADRPRGTKAVPSPLYATMKMLYDNENRVFHANMQGYLNMQGGIKGLGQGGMIGEMVIHVDPKDWYVYIGRPSQMLGIDLAGVANAQAYFMVGTKIESLPLPPSEVIEIVGKSNVRQFDAGMVNGGRGFALGARFSAGFDSKDKDGKERYRPFYATIRIGGGADVMLRDYGKNTYCEGRSGSVGINGWYASGQAYVFLIGRVGIIIKKNRRFDILDLGAAALLQAELPNPTWMKGVVAGRFSILGGLVKGKFHLDFESGEECKMVSQGNELGDFPIIADLKPTASNSEVDVFTAPQASFNMEIGKEIVMENVQNETHTYRVVLDKFSIVQNKKPLTASMEWNKTKDVAMLRTYEVLPGNAQLTAQVKIHWEKKGANGVWESLKDENGSVDYESKEVSFKTGPRPESIPDNNVAYSYPVKRQYNFLKNESSQGYIQLKQDQRYLFESGTGSQAYQFLARFERTTGKTTDIGMQYDPSQKRVKFAIPADLTNETVYQFSLVRKPVESGQVDKNLQRSEIKTTVNDSSSVVVRNNTLEGTVLQANEKKMYESAFRTSKYNSFTEKVNSWSGEQSLFAQNTNGTLSLAMRANTSETFDAFELTGNAGEAVMPPLVQIEASADNAWYRNTIYPLLYQYYGKDISGLTIESRDTTLWGVPPLRALKLFSNEERNGYVLDESHITSGLAPFQQGTVTVEYYLSFTGKNDYEELVNKAINSKVRSVWIEKLRSSIAYHGLEKGVYPVVIKYVLPDKTVTAQRTINIKF